MSEGEICARHFATRQPVRLQWRGGKLTGLENASKLPAKDVWVAPTLTDVQVNGYGGVDFQRDNLTLDDLRKAVRQLQHDACNRIFLTLTTAPWEKMLARLRNAMELRAADAELQAVIAGFHIEGPFLSSETGFRGAHDGTCMLNPTPDLIRALKTITKDLPMLLTMAPERLGAMEAIKFAASEGVTVNLGHTNASAHLLQMAVRSGARGFTHLANGCPQGLDRHDNILWRVMETAGLLVSLIPDQIHVSPALFRVIHRQLPADSIYYTTDAISAAGAPPGRYMLGHLELEVGPDQVVRQPGQTNFAGSALKPIEGVFRAAEMLGGPWQDAWARLSLRPAALVGLPEGLAVGGPADFCLIEMASPRQGQVQVFIGGELRATRQIGPQTYRQ